MRLSEQNKSNIEEVILEVADDRTANTVAEDKVKTENLNAARKERSSRSFVISDENKLIAWLNACGFEHCFGFRKPYVIKTEVKKLWLAGLDIPGCSFGENATEDGTAAR